MRMDNESLDLFCKKKSVLALDATIDQNILRSIVKR